jgi:NAD dependent epimerase/dehydratase family enzyme
MNSFHKFYQDTCIQDLIYFHTWAAVQLTQDLILSLAGPPINYQKYIASSKNTIFCSSKEHREKKKKRRRGDQKLIPYIFSLLV